MKFKWPKREMTPTRRLGIAFWLGSAQTAVIYSLMQDWHGKEAVIQMIQDGWTDTHWTVWLAAWFMLLVLYARNALAFKAETLWMTIKNPAKVNVEADTPRNSQSPAGMTRPLRPPPPPMPPVRQYKNGTYKSGTVPNKPTTRGAPPIKK